MRTMKTKADLLDRLELVCKELKAQCVISNELRAEIVRITDEVAVVTENFELRDRIKDLEGDLSDMESERDEAQGDANSAQDELITAENERDELQEEVAKNGPAVEVLCKVLGISEHDWELISHHPNALNIAREWSKR